MKSVLSAAGLAALSAVPASGQPATPLLCLFRPVCAQGDCDAASFLIEIAPIDHEPGLWFGRDGARSRARDVSPAGAGMRSYVSQEDGQREMISVFAGGEAIYTRHFQVPGRGPASDTAIGQCEVL